MKAIITLLSALLLTLAIEVPLGTLLIKRKDSLIPLILINVLTNPALNLILTIIFSLTQSISLYWIAVVIGEIAVFTIPSVSIPNQVSGTNATHCGSEPLLISPSRCCFHQPC